MSRGSIGTGRLLRVPVKKGERASKNLKEMRVLNLTVSPGDWGSSMQIADVGLRNREVSHSRRHVMSRTASNHATEDGRPLVRPSSP